MVSAVVRPGAGHDPRHGMRLAGGADDLVPDTAIALWHH
jgi:hypothetical protein